MAEASLPPGECALEDLSLGGLAESVLPSRTAEYIGGLCEKLLGEGVARPADLLGPSRRALEAKLSTHAAFSFGELADTLRLRSAVEHVGGHAETRGRPSGRGLEEVPLRRHPRSWSHRGPARLEPTLAAGCRGGSHGSRSPANSHGPGVPAVLDPPTPYRGSGAGSQCGVWGIEQGRTAGRRSRSGGGRRRAPRRQRKPELWEAAERRDEATARRLLQEGCDPEERYLGWTPLMKAAEEGCVEIISMLLEKRVDLEAANKRGRSALSFAAAPSMKRPTAVAALRLLLERGADASHKDHEGLTAEARARREGREEAVRILREFEPSVGAAR